MSELRKREREKGELTRRYAGERPRFICIRMFKYSVEGALRARGNPPGGQLEMAAKHDEMLCALARQGRHTTNQFMRPVQRIRQVFAGFITDDDPIFSFIFLLFFQHTPRSSA